MLYLLICTTKHRESYLKAKLLKLCTYAVHCIIHISFVYMYVQVWAWHLYNEGSSYKYIMSVVVLVIDWKFLTRVMFEAIEIRWRLQTLNIKILHRVNGSYSFFSLLFFFYFFIFLYILYLSSCFCLFCDDRMSWMLFMVTELQQFWTKSPRRESSIILNTLYSRECRHGISKCRSQQRYSIV